MPKRRRGRPNRKNRLKAEYHFDQEERQNVCNTTTAKRERTENIILSVFRRAYIYALLEFSYTVVCLI